MLSQARKHLMNMFKIKKTQAKIFLEQGALTKGYQRIAYLNHVSLKKRKELKLVLSSFLPKKEFNQGNLSKKARICKLILALKQETCLITNSLKLDMNLKERSHSQSFNYILKRDLRAEKEVLLKTKLQRYQHSDLQHNQCLILTNSSQNLFPRLQ